MWMEYSVWSELYASQVWGSESSRKQTEDGSGDEGGLEYESETSRVKKPVDGSTEVRADMTVAVGLRSVDEEGKRDDRRRESRSSDAAVCWRQYLRPPMTTGRSTLQGTSVLFRLVPTRTGSILDPSKLADSKGRCAG